MTLRLTRILLEGAVVTLASGFGIVLYAWLSGAL